MSYQPVPVAIARRLRQPLTFNRAKRDLERRAAASRVLIELMPPTKQREPEEHRATLAEASRQIDRARADGLEVTVVVHGLRDRMTSRASATVTLTSAVDLVIDLKRRFAADGAFSGIEIVDLSPPRDSSISRTTSEITTAVAARWHADSQFRRIVTITRPEETLRRLVEFESEGILAQGTTPFVRGRTYRPFHRDLMIHSHRAALQMFTPESSMRREILRIDKTEFPDKPDNLQLASELAIIAAYEAEFADDPDLNFLLQRFDSSWTGPDGTGNFFNRRPHADVTLISIATQHNPQDPNFPCDEYVSRLDKAIEIAKQCRGRVRFAIPGAVHEGGATSLSRAGVEYLRTRLKELEGTGAVFDGFVTEETARNGEAEIAFVSAYVRSTPEIGELITVTSHAYGARKGIGHQVYGVPTKIAYADFDPSRVWQMPCVEATLNTRAGWALLNPELMPTSRARGTFEAAQAENWRFDHTRVEGTVVTQTTSSALPAGPTHDL